MEQNNLTRVPLEMFSAAEVEPRDIRWLWYPYIALGKVTLIVGESGEGKSTFALNLAAILTRGDPLPLSGEQHEPMNVIYVNSEDDADDTVVPRFMKAGGVRERLFFFSEKKQRLNFSDERIREAIIDKQAGALILDPLASYIGSDVSMNLANEVRPRLEYLIEAARDYGCAIIVVMHMNKAEGMSAKNRASGSGDFVAAARSMLLVGRPPDTDDPDQRVMAHGKSNLSPLGASILFSVSDGVCEFIDTIDITADQLVGMYRAGRAKQTKQAVASRELQSLLSSGAMPQKEIMARMKALGISQRTCELAKASLPIQSVRTKDGFVWRLADRPDGNTATMQ